MALKIMENVTIVASFDGCPSEEAELEIAYGGKRASLTIFDDDQHVTVYIDDESTLRALANHLQAAADGEGHER